jgi:mannose-6-phosphate isomerase-like protein (cupin superfamily)
MRIVHHAHLKTLHGDGEQRLAAADKSLGVQAFEVWVWRLEPSAQSVQRRHYAELAVLVLSGCGKLLIDGGPQRFVAPCTVLVPADLPFQFANHGCEPLQMVAVCSTAPAPAQPGR